MHGFCRRIIHNLKHTFCQNSQSLEDKIQCMSESHWMIPSPAGGDESSATSSGSEVNKPAAHLPPHFRPSRFCVHICTTWSRIVPFGDFWSAPVWTYACLCIYLWLSVCTCVFEYMLHWALVCQADCLQQLGPQTEHRWREEIRDFHCLRYTLTFFSHHTCSLNRNTHMHQYWAVIYK